MPEKPFVGEHPAERLAAKRVLREQMRARRLALTQERVKESSRIVVSRLEQLDGLRQPGGVALYAAMIRHRELDLTELAVALLAKRVALFFPFFERTELGTALGFRRITELTQLQARGQGFLEPEPGLPEARPGDLSLIVLPALAITANGVRLGFGAGFYDRILPVFCPPAESAVVAYDFQLVEQLPEDSHDRRCDRVVTDSRVADQCPCSDDTCRTARGDDS